MFRLKYWAIGLLVAVTVLAAASMGYVGVHLLRFVHPYLDRDLSRARVITSEWTEIVPDIPLKVERETQTIVLEVDPSIRSSLPKQMGLLLPDGTVVVPEVQLVDQDGQIYQLHLGYQSGPLSFEPPSKAPWPIAYLATQPLPK